MSNVKIIKTGDEYQLIKTDEDGNEQIVKRSESFKEVQSMFLKMQHEEAMNAHRALRRSY